MQITSDSDEIMLICQKKYVTGKAYDTNIRLLDLIILLEATEHDLAKISSNFSAF